MTIRVLNVGQCAFDHGSIARVLMTLGAQTIKVDFHRDVLRAINQHSPALILVNRVNDSDASSGIDLIRELKSDAEVSTIPVMLISNHADAQQAAIQAGAIPGFGKYALHSPATASLLRSVLT